MFIWLAVIVICGTIEALTMNIVTAWFVVGGIASVIANLLGANSLTQSIIFVIVSVLCLILVRPLAIKALRNKKPERFNKDALIDKLAVVTTAIPNGESTGEIKLDGKFWRAKSADGEAISENSEVKVLGIKGVTLTVETITNEV